MKDFLFKIISNQLGWILVTLKPYFQQSVEDEDFFGSKKKSGDKGGCGDFIMQVLPVTVKLPEFYGTIMLVYPIPSYTIHVL